MIMSIPEDIRGREFAKFADDGLGQTAVRITGTVNTVDVTDQWNLQTILYSDGLVSSIVCSYNGETIKTLVYDYDEEGNVTSVTKII